LRPARRFLGQSPDARSSRHHDTAVLDADLASDGAEQRRLADAVAPDHTDARAFGNARRCAIQQKAAGDADRDVVEHEHGAFLRATRRMASALARAARAGDPAAPNEEWTMCVPGCREVVGRALSRRGFFGAAVAAVAVTPALAQRTFTSVIDLT